MLNFKKFQHYLSAYGNDLHYCMLNVAMADMNVFADKAVRIKPLSETQFELLKDNNAISVYPGAFRLWKTDSFTHRCRAGTDQLRQGILQRAGAFKALS